jgi:hypothetical protein
MFFSRNTNQVSIVLGKYVFVECCTVTVIASDL